MATETITGTLTCHKYARIRGNGRVTLGSLLADYIEPLPPWEIWTIQSTTEEYQPGRPRLFKMRSNKLPSCLSRDQEGQVVTVRASVKRFDNGLGGYISRASVMAPPQVRESIRNGPE